MTTKDRVYLQNLDQAAGLSIEGLRVFQSWLRAWQNHPNAGSLPPDLLESVFRDLELSGNGHWLNTRSKATLRRIVTGVTK